MKSEKKEPTKKAIIIGARVFRKIPWFIFKKM